MATLNDNINFGSSVDQVLADNSLVKSLALVTTLYARTTTAGPHATPRKIGEAVGYLVPPGKKFVVTAIEIANNTGGGGQAGLTSADTDVGMAAASAGTNADDTGNGDLGQIPNSDRNIRTGLRIIPENKYLNLFVGTSGTAATVIYGYEIDASAALI